MSRRLILIAALLSASPALAQHDPMPTVAKLTTALSACIDAVAARSQQPILDAGIDTRMDPSLPIDEQPAQVLLHGDGAYMRLRLTTQGPNNRAGRPQHTCTATRTGLGGDQPGFDHRLMAGLAALADTFAATDRFTAASSPSPATPNDRVLVLCRPGEADIAVHIAPRGSDGLAGGVVWELPDGSRHCQ